MVYEHPLEQEDGSVKNIHLDEFQAALKCGKGTRMPTAAGIRMGNMKYLMVRHEDNDGIPMSILTKTGGGACVALSKNAVVIGIWDKETIMSNNGN